MSAIQPEFERAVLTQIARAFCLDPVRQSNSDLARQQREAERRRAEHRATEPPEPTL